MATLDGVPRPLATGDCLVVPLGTELSLQPMAEGFTARCCLPTGGQAVMADGEPFTPPWAL